MHQDFSYNPDPMYSCEEFGCNPVKIWGNNFYTNFCCFRCDICMTASNNALEEMDWALSELSLNLYE